MQGLKHLDDSILPHFRTLITSKRMKIMESDPTIFVFVQHTDGLTGDDRHAVRSKERSLPEKNLDNVS